MYLKYLALTLCAIATIQSSGCQNIQMSTKVIASIFNASTNVQKKMIDKYAPEEILVQKNITYMQEPKLTLDVYQPKNVTQLEARPTVVWIHGGGWVSGSKEHAGGYFKLLADQGYNVVSVQYQFAPEAIYPNQLLQINQALKFITEHAQQYHINANQIYLAGDSAGANLVSHYAALISNPTFAQQSKFTPLIQRAQIKGLILHCGIYDMNAFVNTAPDKLKLIEWGVFSLVQSYTGNKKDDVAFLKTISPIQYLTANYPPVFISGGNKDFLTKTQSEPFVQALVSQKIPVTEVFYPDSKESLVHEYQFMMSKAASQETFKKTIDFISYYSPSSKE
ncbi:alpha/beta hydrolase [Acinetobacter sp. ANC 4470]|uniref:alpha/beta hydrolase n=1 Tax=Acinetobacter sp. ANC 4470 TaxID=1977881 RepID=UPI000A334464|nr:alpha/beta hydrolase [Acinetobacter sp. ANC 4470]OTG67911.1 alpha/beta hydrolase [Acinetobacter sp. ANC 4470]